MKRHVIGVAAAVLGTMLMGGVVVQTASAADPLPTTVTLPLFGAPLAIGVTTGPGNTLTEVTVDPTTSTTADTLRPHKVVFTSADPTDPTSTAKVVVRSRKGGQSVSARAGTLANVSGPGIWAGDVFGDGTLTTVNFTVLAAADGTPDITVDPTITGLVGVIGDVQHSTETNDEGTESSARVSVKFTNADGDQSRSLSIGVKVETATDGTTEAKLSVSLSGLKAVAVAAADAAGPHTWSGVLCDNTAATITYDVALDGTISNVVATPATADVRTGDSKIDARFSHDERVRIRVREDNGMIKISVDERIRCRDAADPTTNVSTSVPADNDDANDDANEHQGGHHGHNDDDASTTTDVTTPVAGG
jgi:hypothetical protein